MSAAVDRSRSIRVLQLGSPSGLYGAERWILALVHHLPRTQFESVVGVIIDDPCVSRAELCREADESGVTTVQFRAHGKLSFKAISAIRNYLINENIDILHTHGYKTDLIGRLATIGTDCRNVTTPHGWSKDAGIVVQCYEWLGRLSFMFMDAVVPLSMDLYEGLRRWPRMVDRLRLIPNGVDLSEIDATLPDSSPDSPEEPFVFGYIGQLIPRKGVDTLIRAFRRLNLAHSELWIVGDGPERRNLEQLVQQLGKADAVRFFGFRDDRIKLLRRFDTFVLPSSLEGIPRCLMEAMGAGVPVIASNIHGCSDLIESGRTGLLFDKGDEEGLVQVMRLISADSSLRRSLGLAGRAFVRQHYSAQAMADAYGTLYSSLLVRPAAGHSHAGAR